MFGWSLVVIVIRFGTKLKKARISLMGEMLLGNTSRLHQKVLAKREIVMYAKKTKVMYRSCEESIHRSDVFMIHKFPKLC